MTTIFNEGSSHNSVDDFLDSLEVPIEESRDAKNIEGKRDSPRFSALAYFENNETKQTEIIAFLLDPREKHGQGTIFLRQFLKCAWPSISDNEWTEESLYRSHIYREHYVECESEDKATSRPIDLWIELDNGSVLAIESKAKDAPDQYDQVGSYLCAVRKRRDVLSKNSPYKLLYLHESREAPSPKSIDETRWQDECGKGHAEVKKYSDFIGNWLRSCKDKCESLRIEFFIEDFLAFIDPADERLSMTPKTLPLEIASLLKVGASDGLPTARRNTLLSIWETSDLIFDKLLRVFQENLLKSLDTKGIKYKIGNGEGKSLPDDVWGQIHLIGEHTAESSEHTPDVAIERSKGHRLLGEHLTMGIHPNGLSEHDCKRWRKLAKTTKLEKGTGDSGWVWQRVLEGFEDLRSREAAINLLDPNAADEVATRMRDCLPVIEQIRCATVPSGT